MQRSLAAVTAASILAITATAAEAKTLPAIKAGGGNAVPECATPGRLMAFIAERNAKLDTRFSGIATSYMRHGEQLGLRWDYAFFQMILETGNLSYTRDGTKPGDVKPKQNNFAGLGATGKGEPGESFASVDEGVKAHLQHLAMYSGEQVEAPVAERTRKVQEWGVLVSWQKGFKRQITFSDLAAKWAPGSRGYASNIDSIAGDFYDGACKKADSKPELVQEARAGRATTTASKAPAAKSPTTAAQTTKGRASAAEASPGAEFARQAMDRGREEGDATRSGLGAKTIVAAKPYGGETAPSPGFTILNDERPDEAAATPSAAAPAAAAEPPAAKATPSFQTASAAGSASAAGAAKATNARGAATAKATTVAAAATLPKTTPPADTAPAAGAAGAAAAVAAGKCRVYTASYGGQRAVIIRASAEQFVNFTVLDVNEGQEAREIEAYVSAYAKGGQKVGDFSSSNAALDKAFQLCPEG